MGAFNTRAFGGIEWKLYVDLGMHASRFPEGNNSFDSQTTKLQIYQSLVLSCRTTHIFTLTTQRLPTHAHRLNVKLTKLSPTTAQKNATIGCGPTVSTSSPLIGMQIKVASEAIKYTVP
jgi:hypothetical protein